MIYLSFDVGITHLAYCKGNNAIIIQWEVVNLLQFTCCYHSCDTLAIYNTNNKYYCDKHKITSRKLNANNVSINDIKYNLVKFLTDNEMIADIIIIENQPSLKNPKIKSIAETIYCYYLIKKINYLPIEIHYFNPSRKINGTTYKDRKKNSITKCLELLKSFDNANLLVNTFISHKKKDDLSDCFLQMIIFITNNHYIINNN